MIRIALPHKVKYDKGLKFIQRTQNNNNVDNDDRGDRY